MSSEARSTNNKLQDVFFCAVALVGVVCEGMQAPRVPSCFFAWLLHGRAHPLGNGAGTARVQRRLAASARPLLIPGRLNVGLVAVLQMKSRLTKKTAAWPLGATFATQLDRVTKRSNV